MKTINTAKPGTGIPTTLPAQYDFGFDSNIKLDIDQIMELYTRLMEAVKIDVMIDYKATRISGPRYAETMAELQKAAMSSSVGAIVSLMSKETSADRCVKRSQCDKMKKEMEMIDTQKLKVIEETTRIIPKSVAEVNLLEGKFRAEQIKNGDSPDKGSKGDSLYGFNKKVLGAQENLYKRQG